MSKIVFFSTSYDGHINPTLAIVRELVSQGHQVWYYSYNSYKEEIESAGATFVSCDEYDCKLTLSPEELAQIDTDIRFSVKVMVNTTLAMDKKVVADMEEIKPDCIVADTAACWGKAVALKLGIPFVASNTTMLFNRRYPKETERRTFSEYLKYSWVRMRANMEARRLKKAGYPVRSAKKLLKSGRKTDTIVYTTKEFQPRADTFPSKFTFVGPLLKPAKVETRKRLDTLIYVSMRGINAKLPKLYENIIRAYESWNAQVIVSAGDIIPEEEFMNVPINFFLYKSVDQISVLEKSAAFVTHCGMNSVCEALALGVPLLLIPRTDEQWRVAERVAELGAGIILQRYDWTSIQKATVKLIEEDSYKENAAKIAENFKNASGAKAAVEKILSLCNN